MDVGASDAALPQHKSAPAAVQRAPKRKRDELGASPSTDAGGHGTRRASQRRRLSAPAARAASQPVSQRGKAALQPGARERKVINRQTRRDNTRLLREAAAKRAAPSRPSPARSIAAGAGSPPAADLEAGPQTGGGSAEAPQSPDVAAPVQVLAVASRLSAAQRTEQATLGLSARCHFLLEVWPASMWI